jgi:ribosome-binding protein aMBF1 (putative translation factor)
MTIRDYVLSENDRLFSSTDSVEPEKIEQYRRELAEDYQNFVVEDRQRIAKTAELSQKIVIA